jgi:ATP-dependent Clp protease ATP-binding subunit ClpC
VRLQHAQLPEEAREVEKELRKVQKEKDASVRAQEFEKAGELRDTEMELKVPFLSLFALLPALPARCCLKIDRRAVSGCV